MSIRILMSTGVELEVKVLPKRQGSELGEDEKMGKRRGEP